MADILVRVASDKGVVERFCDASGSWRRLVTVAPEGVGRTPDATGRPEEDEGVRERFMGMGGIFARVLVLRG